MGNLNYMHSRTYDNGLMIMANHQTLSGQIWFVNIWLTKSNLIRHIYYTSLMKEAMKLAHTQRHTHTQTQSNVNTMNTHVQYLPILK